MRTAWLPVADTSRRQQMMSGDGVFSLVVHSAIVFAGVLPPMRLKSSSILRLWRVTAQHCSICILKRCCRHPLRSAGSAGGHCCGHCVPAGTPQSPCCKDRLPSWQAWLPGMAVTRLRKTRLELSESGCDGMCSFCASDIRLTAKGVLGTNVAVICCSCSNTVSTQCTAQPKDWDCVALSDVQVLWVQIVHALLVV